MRPKDPPPTTLAERFPHQEAVGLPADHVLTDEDRRAIARGEAFFVTGRVFAKAHRLCERLGSDEIFWYFTAPLADSAVVTDLLVPEQTVSPGGCHVEGGETLRSARRAERQGNAIVAAGHSHGRGTLFSSGTDRAMLLELTREKVGRVTQLPHRHHGRVRAAASPAPTKGGAK